MPAVTIDRLSPTRTSTWRTGAYAVQHMLEYRDPVGYPAARALLAQLPTPIHLHHMTGDGWALRDLTSNGSTFTWATSGSRRGLDSVELMWSDLAADNAGCDFILVAHAYTSFITGADNNNGRPGSNTEAAQFADIVAEVLDRYPGRYFAVMYGQELKGGYSRSNPTEFIGHFNAFSARLKTLHPDVKVIGPHMGFYGYSNAGADPYSQRTADMNGLLASSDGTTAIDAGHNTGEEDGWLADFIDQCWDHFDYLGLDVSIVDNNDTVAQGRVGNWTHIRQRVRLLEAMQRRAERLMLDAHGTTKPIYWAEKYIDVNISTHPPEYTEAEQAVGMVLLDLYAAQGLGLQRGCLGTNTWQPEGGQTTASANNYAWFTDTDDPVDYPGAGDTLARSTPFLHWDYLLAAALRFGEGQVFVETTSDDAERIHPFCNDQGAWLIFNASTTSQDVEVTDVAGGVVFTVTVPPVSMLAGQLADPTPTGPDPMLLGYLTAETTDGADSVIPCDFAPQLAYFWCTNQTAIGVANGAILAHGWADAASNQWWVGAAMDDAQTTKNTGKAMRTDSAIGVISNGTPTVVGRAVVSMDADSVTLDWIDAPPSGVLIGYLILGGLDAAQVGTLTIPTVGSVPFNLDTTGLLGGATPDVVLLGMSRIAAASVPGGTAHAQLGFGGFDAAGTIFGQLLWEGDAIGAGVNTAVTTSYSSTEPVRLANDTASAGIDVRADTPSMLAGGFRLSITNTPGGGDMLVGYVAISSDRVALFTETKPTSSTSKKTTLPFRAGAGIVWTVGSTADHTGGTSQNTSGAGVGFAELGAFTADAQQMAGLYSDDGITTSDATRRFDDASLLFMGDPPAPTTMGTASVDTIEDDGLTLAWTGADANARRFAGVVFAAGAVEADLELDSTADSTDTLTLGGTGPLALSSDAASTDTLTLGAVAAVSFDSTAASSTSFLLSSPANAARRAQALLGVGG